MVKSLYGNLSILLAFFAVSACKQTVPTPKSRQDWQAKQETIRKADAEPQEDTNSNEEGNINNNKEENSIKNATNPTEVGVAQNCKGTIENNICFDGEHAYANFSQELRKLCEEKQGGEACKTNRWDADFTRYLLKISGVSSNNKSQAKIPQKQESNQKSSEETTSSSVAQELKEQEDFNAFIINSVDILLKNDTKLGYSMKDPKGHHTRSLTYDGKSIFSIGNKKSHCVGITFQAFIMALNTYYEKTSDKRAWNMPADFMRWTPFKNCWYVNSGCKGARDALVKYGTGMAITSFSQLKKGDFINYDRVNGTGHSVIFLGFIDENGKEIDTYNKNVIGFTYFSSQQSTNGVGKKRAFFSGVTCPTSSDDCGIIFKSLVMGRAYHPKNFKPITGLALNELISEPEGTVPSFYDNSNN